MDAIVEVTETGSSLAANNLRIIDDISSTPRLIANRDTLNDWKRKKIETVAMLLRGLDAETKVGMKFNIEEKNLSKVLKKLPALRNQPFPASGSSWVAVGAVIGSCRPGNHTRAEERRSRGYHRVSPQQGCT